MLKNGTQSVRLNPRPSHYCYKPCDTPVVNGLVCIQRYSTELASFTQVHFATPTLSAFQLTFHTSYSSEYQKATWFQYLAQNWAVLETEAGKAQTTSLLIIKWPHVGAKLSQKLRKVTPHSFPPTVVHHVEESKECI